MDITKLYYYSLLIHFYVVLLLQISKVVMIKVNILSMLVHSMLAMLLVKLDLEDKPGNPEYHRIASLLIIETQALINKYR